VKESGFRQKVLNTVLDLCVQDSYELVQDFKWLIKSVVIPIATIVEKTKDSGFDSKLSSILLDIALKMEDTRQEAITQDCFDDLKERFIYSFLKDEPGFCA